MVDLCGFDIFDVFMIVYCCCLFKWKNIFIFILFICENFLKIYEYFCVLLIIIFDRNDILILKVS